MSITVTAAQAGAGSAIGIELTVKVLTGQAASPAGTTATSVTATAPQLSITPAATGSWVYGAVTNLAANTAFTANGSTTFSANVPDTTNGIGYGTFRSTSTTTASTPVTVGASAPTETSGFLPIALLEIEKGTTLAEDASSPAAVSAFSATTVTTASFTPPGGSLLVAMVCSDATGDGVSSMNMTVSGGGLTWTKNAVAAAPIGSATYDIASVWTAPVPSAAATAPVTVVPVPPGRRSPASFPRIQPPPPPLLPPAVTVTAGLPSATAAALSPAATVIPNPGTASATAAALSPAVTVTAVPGAAAATATAFQPAVVITPSPGTAPATATAQGPVPNVIPNPGTASATAAAQSPAILTGTVASPAAASATATAQSPALQVSNTAAAGLPHATAAALQPVVVITPGAGLAHATATALQPAAGISTTVTPGVAHAAATASSPGFGTALKHFGVTFTEPGPVAVLTENAFGAVLTGQKLGAGLTLPSLGGSLVPVSPSATCTIPGFGATLTTPAFSAVLTEGTMQQASLTLSEFNDMTINIAVTNNGSPYNLTSQNLNLLLKSQAGVPDTQALIFSSSGGSPAITITNAAQGLATAQIPNVDLDAETYNFYRLDVVNASSQQQTTVYGPIVWITL